MRQVVIEHDMWIAMFDYMGEQLDGRFRVQFPDSEDIIDQVLKDLNNPFTRSDYGHMRETLGLMISVFGTSLTGCLVDGCHEDANHEFIREFINLVWDARWLTSEWLKENGTIPGQSVN